MLADALEAAPAILGLLGSQGKAIATLLKAMVKLGKADRWLRAKASDLRPGLERAVTAKDLTTATVAKMLEELASARERGLIAGDAFAQPPKNPGA